MEVEYVYVLHCPETGLRKIGYTSNYPQRMVQLQKDSAYSLDVEGSTVLLCLAGTGKIFEALLHWKFRKCRTHGEWFKLSEDDMRCFDPHIVASIQLEHLSCLSGVGLSQPCSSGEYLAIPTNSLSAEQLNCQMLFQEGKNHRIGFTNEQAGTRQSNEWERAGVILTADDRRV